MSEPLNPDLVYHELKQIRKTIEDHTVTDATNFAELRRLLEGSDASPGIRIRVDRLEQADKSRATQKGFIWSAIGTLAAGLGVNFFL